MSEVKALLHERLLQVAEVAAEVGRVRTLREVVATVGAGLERLGVSVGVLSLEEGSYGVRYVTATPGNDAVRALFTGSDPTRRWPQLEQVVMRATQAPLLVPDVDRILKETSPEAARLVPQVPRQALVAPLRVHGAHWGALMVMHDELREADVEVMRVLATQVSSAIEHCGELEQLDRRNAELELVHELAAAGTSLGSTELCARALATLCRTTQTNAAVLHRRDESGEYVQTGDVYGSDGAVSERWRRFRLPPLHARMPRPLALPIAAVELDTEALRSLGILQMAMVPLTIDGTHVGLLTLARTHDTPYSEADMRTAEILGVQLTTVLDRARLYEQMTQLYEDLKASYDKLARTQQELVRHERLAAVGELAAVMAHEVRNPLGVIFNCLTTIKRISHPEGDVELMLNMVGEEADRLNRIVGDLMDFVRPYELVKKLSAVEPVIANAIDAAALSVLNGNVKVLTEFPRELPAFPIDAHLLRQALINLIVNAAQSMPRGGTVLVHAETEVPPEGGRPWLVVRVRDEGVGLTEKASAKIFQPFFTTKATGTGLGLAVVKRIIDSHLGDVSARANDDGPGTTFTVRLPPTTETREGTMTPPQGLRAR